MIAMTELERSDLFQRTNQNVRSHQIRKKKSFSELPCVHKASRAYWRRKRDCENCAISVNSQNPWLCL